MSFENMQLNEKLLRAILTQRYKNPTEIQAKTIPLIMEGNDILATADTGSGKTLAFILPALHRIVDEPEEITKGKGPKILVLAPTRELANQIAETTRKMSQFIQFKFGTVTGGVPYHFQERLLRNRCDLLIATPGRLLDHMERGLVDYSRIEMFVLDEADRMLDMGFKKDIDKIIDAMPKDRQTLLFSATIDGPVQNVANKLLTDPQYIKLANGTKPHALITQHIYATNDFKHKQALLMHLLEDAKIWQAIVFTKTKRGAEELAIILERKGMPCAALHGDMKQSKRTRTLEQVHRGAIRILIATDVAARGLDVKNLSHVINFDMPNNVDDYIHRIGRTGRSGSMGTAITLVGPQDWFLISAIEKMMNKRLDRQVIEGLEPNHSEPRSGRAQGSENKRNARFKHHKSNRNNNNYSNSSNSNRNSDKYNEHKEYKGSANRSSSQKKKTYGKAKPKASMNFDNGAERSKEKSNHNQKQSFKPKPIPNSNPKSKPKSKKNFKSGEKKSNEKNFFLNRDGLTEQSSRKPNFKKRKPAFTA